jgi:RNA polymerase sigma-70 factor (ECF subfamily)
LKPDLIYKKKEAFPVHETKMLTLVSVKRYSMPSKNIILEKTLLSKLKSGDNHAFSTIFEAYYRDLVLFASRFTKSLDSSEEIVQDIFVKLWEDHAHIEINVSLKSFLLKSVQNKCIDLIRHKRIVNEHCHYIFENQVLSECNTDNYILYTDLQEKIEIALEKLPCELSDAFKMNRFKGLKYDEIAEILNVSVRTIEVRIGKALSALRIELKEYI